MVWSTQLLRKDTILLVLAELIIQNSNEPSDSPKYNFSTKLSPYPRKYPTFVSWQKINRDFCTKCAHMVILIYVSHFKKIILMTKRQSGIPVSADLTKNGQLGSCLFLFREAELTGPNRCSPWNASGTGSGHSWFSPLASSPVGSQSWAMTVMLQHTCALRVVGSGKSALTQVTTVCRLCPETRFLWGEEWFYVKSVLWHRLAHFPVRAQLGFQFLATSAQWF